MQKIHTCVIPAAGMGTRFLPATKALPKEMFPVVDKPVMQYLVEEAIDAWCEEIIIITGRSKRAIEDHFDSNPELEARLDNTGKFDYLKKVTNISKNINIVYVRQPYPKGDGDAILRVKNLVWNNPFLVLFGDDIIDNPISAWRQLVSQYEKNNCSIIASIDVNPDEVSQYGIIETDKNWFVTHFVEKPKIWTIHSHTAVIGKYILTPEIFSYLENAQSSLPDTEIRLADAFISMCHDKKDIFAHSVQGERYDTGNKLWYLKACIAFWLKDEEISHQLKQYCLEISTWKK